MTHVKQRHLANTMLALSAVLFAVAFYLRKIFPHELVVQLLLAVSEAALVGGIADWFAVTALFRKPLGFPYHTALIPRNRQRMIEATVHMVENELLSTESIQQKLSQIRLTKLLIQWIETKQGKIFILGLLVRYTQSVAHGLNSRTLALQIESWLKGALQAHSFSPWLKSLGTWLVREQKESTFFDRLLEQLLEWTKRPESTKTFQVYLEKYTQPSGDSLAGLFKLMLLSAAQEMNAVNLADAARALQKELSASLEDLRSPQHPMRLWILAQLREFVDHLDQPGPLTDSMESWKKALIERLELADVIEKMILQLKSYVEQSPEELAQLYSKVKADGQVAFTLEEAKHFRKSAPVLAFVLGQFERFWEAFKTDAARQDFIEVYLQQLVSHLVASEHKVIGQVAHEALQRLSDEDLVALVEEKAGDDLQWVRVNGSLVGGAVGLILFCYLHFIHFPYILPWLKGNF